MKRNKYYNTQIKDLKELLKEKDKRLKVVQESNELAIKLAADTLRIKIESHDEAIKLLKEIADKSAGKWSVAAALVMGTISLLTVIIDVVLNKK